MQPITVQCERAFNPPLVAKQLITLSISGIQEFASVRNTGHTLVEFSFILSQNCIFQLNCSPVSGTTTQLYVQRPIKSLVIWNRVKMKQDVSMIPPKNEGWS